MPTSARSASTPLAPAAAAASDDAFVVTADGLRYALDRPPRPHGRRSVASVRLAEHPGAAALRDRVDLYAFKSREAFARRVADAFERQVGEVLGHLALVLDTAERSLAGEGSALRADAALSGERRAAGQALLGAPDLLDRAAAAMEAQGHVGEEALKRLGYLVATSRLLARPLSALLLAPSGTGKSALLDAVAALLPPEQLLPLARLTPHALYYMGQDALRHKLVVVDEYEGASEADHPLRVLQSKGELRLSVTVKGRAEAFCVRGPVAVMSGTTALDLDLQNTSRCLELALDDSPAQTRRIQAAQARAFAGAGPAGARGARGARVETLRDAQRLLEPAAVVVPFAARLTFPARTPTDRRGSAKLLGLVAAHALLHQRQRERDAAGRVVATPGDYAAVHALLTAGPACRQAAPDLSPRAARAADLLAAAPGPLSRRELATRAGWAYNTAKKALAELAGQELAARCEVGPPTRYRLLEPASRVEQGALLPPAALA